MRQWTGPAFVDIMARGHCLNQHWIIVHWTLRNKLQWNSNQNTKLHENAFRNFVWEMSAILIRRDGLKCESILFSNKFTWLSHYSEFCSLALSAIISIQTKVHLKKYAYCIRLLILGVVPCQLNLTILFRVVSMAPGQLSHKITLVHAFVK